MEHPHEHAGRPAPLSRPADGRWLGGVAAGIARATGLPAGAVRAAFVLGAAIAGLGALAYVACWLIIPAEGERAGAAAAAAPRGIATVVLAGAGALGLGTLAAIGAAATVFGFGWIVAVTAAAILVGALATWSRLGPGWALLPVAALVLPSIAVAAGGVHVAAQTGAVRFAPATAADLPRAGYRSGLGTMLVDLRHTALPAAGVVNLRIRAGVARTIVALPHRRCVPVAIDYDLQPFAARAASLVLGRTVAPDSWVRTFGETRFGTSGRTGNAVAPGRADAATLHIDFASAGGSLDVRDYPDGTDPGAEPEWPGFQVYVEPRPSTQGLTRSEARREVRSWRARRAQELRSRRLVDRNLPGPCARAEAAR